MATGPMAQARKIENQAQFEYETVTSTNVKSKVNGRTRKVIVTVDGENGLVDPLGTITGCNGLPLPSYAGYSVLLFNTVDRINPTSIVALDRTNAANGIEPNITNINPFSLNNSTDGRYNFLFNRGQTVIGKSYILVVKTPENSSYGERRVIIDITGFDGNILSYQATSLDGQPLSTTESNVRKASIPIVLV
jgi:hypothetical protein